MNNVPPIRRRQMHAFSLVELLVVIGVVVLLVGILVPALSAARQASRRAVLLANLSHSTAVLQTYAHDQRDAFPATGAPYANIPFQLNGRPETLAVHFFMSELWFLFIADAYLGGQLRPASVRDPRGGFLNMSCTTLAEPNYFDPFLWTGRSQLNGQRFANAVFPSKKVLLVSDNFTRDTPNGFVEPRRAGLIHYVAFVDGHAAALPTADWHSIELMGCMQVPDAGRHSTEHWPGGHTPSGIRGSDIR